MATKTTTKIQQQGVLYVERTGFSFYGSQLPQIVQGTFDPEAVKDLDLINKERLDSSIKQFIETHKISATNLVIVLSENVLFIKDFLTTTQNPAQGQKHGEAKVSPKPAPSTSQSQPTQPVQSPVKPAQPVQPPQPAAQQPSTQPITTQPASPATPAPQAAPAIDPNNLAQQYLDSIPFEDVASKIVTIEGGVRVIAANRELFEGLKYAFELAGNMVEAVVPIIMYGKSVVMTAGFTPVVAQAILHRSDITRQNNLLIKPRPVITEQQTEHEGESETNEKPSNTRLFLMLGVMGILFLFMIGLYYVMYIAPKNEGTQVSHTPVTTHVTTAIPSVAPTLASSAPVTNSTSSAVLIPSTLSVQIVATASQAKDAASLKKTFTSLGIATVTITNTTNPPLTKTVIVFSSTVDSATQTALLEEVKKIYPQITAQVNKDLKSDVVITLGK